MKNANWDFIFKLELIYTRVFLNRFDIRGYLFRSNCVILRCAYDYGTETIEFFGTGELLDILNGSLINL